MYAALPLQGKRLFSCFEPVTPRSQWGNLTIAARPALSCHFAYQTYIADCWLQVTRVIMLTTASTLFIYFYFFNVLVFDICREVDDLRSQLENYSTCRKSAFHAVRIDISYMYLLLDIVTVIMSVFLLWLTSFPFVRLTSPHPAAMTQKRKQINTHL